MSEELIDLSFLPAPDVVEALSFERILGEIVEDFKGRFPEFSGFVENEPVMKLMEAVAYRELIVRQRINDAAHAVMPAYARGADLDHIALIFGVRRLVLQAADAEAVPPVPAVMEDDEGLRKRYFLAINALNTAGSRNSYVYHAFSCPDVRDVAAWSDVPGVVVVAVLGRSEDGVPEVGTLEAVERILNAEDVRPLTDTVMVRAARVVRYSVRARIVTMEGPDGALVVEAARRAVMAYVEGVSLIGRDVALSGLYAALHQAGVERVVLSEPAESVMVDRDAAGFCEGIFLTHEVLSS